MTSGLGYGARDAKENQSCPNHKEHDPKARDLHNAQIRVFLIKSRTLNQNTKCQNKRV